MDSKGNRVIHFQLNTKHKLFCDCSTEMKEKDPIGIIKRKQHVVLSELGEKDRAAEYEALRDRTFYYQVFKNESCLVETDEEPPHAVNKEALKIALQIALLLNCEIPDEIHVMRKIVLDGSNVSGFQRTMIVGRNGYLKYGKRRIGIANICLEEDAAAIIKEENGNVYYRLNRLGIPLVEIATETLENFSPQEIQDIAYTLGLMAKSTRMIKSGIGTIRQDINVSIKGGDRVEIKGIQELGLLTKVIELEVERQADLIKGGKKVERETRVVNPDGTTRFTRPLPGAGRMYPESDIKPIPIPKFFLQKIRGQLPEPLIKKLIKFKKELKLPNELAKQILRSEHLEIFEKIVGTKNVEPTVVASTFLHTLKDLERREKVAIENLEEKHFLEAFDFLARKKIAKEALPEILKYLARNPSESVGSAVRALGLTPIGMPALKKVIEEVVAQKLPFEKTYGIVMSRVRGRVDAEVVKKVLKRYFE